MVNEDPHQKGNPKPADPSALRDFIQRGETRLSSMHRVAGVFLNGAGLLVIFPVFLADAFRDVVGALLEGITKQASVQEHLAFWGLAAVVAISLFTVVIGLYWLVRDIIEFYFIYHRPGYRFRDPYPRFSLTGLAYPADEQDPDKRRIIEEEYTEDIIRMLVPPKADKGEKMPAGDPREVDYFTPRARKPQEELGKLIEKSSPAAKGDRDKFNIELGQAGVTDQNLHQEAAAMEATVARYSIHLRRLVLRYAKALLLLIWTMLITVLISALLKRNGEDALASEPMLKTYWVLAASYFVWALVTAWLVRRPLNWIYRFHEDKSDRYKDIQAEPQLVPFEYLVYGLCAFSLMAIFTSLYFFLQSR